jgi:hypothetical protein
MERIRRWVHAAVNVVGSMASVASWAGLSFSTFVALAFGAWAWIEQWGHLPAALVGLFAFVCAAVAYRVLQPRARHPPPTATRTSCKLSFTNDGNPTATSLENIRRWYALNNFITLFDKEKENEQTFGVTILFLNFESPINLKQIHIYSSGTPLPRYEVKDRDSHYVIIVFSKILSNTMLNVDIEV